MAVLTVKLCHIARHKPIEAFEHRDIILFSVLPSSSSVQRWPWNRVISNRNPRTTTLTSLSCHQIVCRKHVFFLYWSPCLARSLLFFCRWLCLSVCLSRCSFKSILLFCFSMESSHFWPSSLHVTLYKTLFFDFWFRPPNAQNLLPKMACDNAILSRRHPWSRTRQFSSCLGKVGNPLNLAADPWQRNFA